MTREEAHTLLEIMAINLTGAIANSESPVTEQTKLMAKQIEAIDMAIEALSERTGMWIMIDPIGEFQCDQCGWTVIGTCKSSKFCPNCGARMKGGEQNDD